MIRNSNVHHQSLYLFTHEYYWMKWVVQMTAKGRKIKLGVRERKCGFRWPTLCNKRMRDGCVTPLPHPAEVGCRDHPKWEMKRKKERERVSQSDTIDRSIYESWTTVCDWWMEIVCTFCVFI